MMNELAELASDLRELKSLRLVAAKLPRYANGRVFVPVVDEAWAVFLHCDGRRYVAARDVIWLDGWIPVFAEVDRDWTHKFYPTQEDAQAEADRLSKE